MQRSVVKDRSRKVTSYFESYATWDSMVGTTQKAWAVEFGKDPRYVVAHTSNYVQCLVPREDGLVGKCLNVKIDSAEKWCVKATLLGIEKESEFLPQVQKLHPIPPFLAFSLAFPPSFLLAFPASFPLSPHLLLFLVISCSSTSRG